MAVSTAALSTGGLARTWMTRLSLASVAPMADFGGRFARTLLLSRLLSPVEFGTSVALMVVLGTSQMISDVGLDRFVILKSEAEGRRGLAAAHVIQLVRGLILAAGVLATANVASRFFDVPFASRSFAWAALVPLIHGFSHLGTKRAYRTYDFRREAIATLATSVAAVLAAIVATFALRDHRAVLVSVIAAEATYVIVTHALSTEPYELALDRPMIREALRFGLPLTLNGIGLAMFAQADRMIVGAAFGVEVLGAYAVILSLAIVIMSPLTAICSSLAVPILARSRPHLDRFPAVFETVARAYGLYGFAYCAVVGLSLDLMVPMIYGAQYTVEPGVRIVLAFMALVRILRGPATTLFLVDGDTRRLSLANLVAGVGLGLAVWFVSLSPTLESVLLGLLIGDCLSFAAFQALLSRRLPAIRSRSVRLLGIEAAFAAGLGCALLATTGADVRLRGIVAAGCCVALAWMAGRALRSAGRADMRLHA